MRSVVKRNYIKTPSGRVLASSTERLVEDGSGRVHVSQQNTPLWCPGCRRPLSGFQDLRGTCDACGRTSTCHTCEAHCRACSRRLCTGCRRGFAGPQLVTVCPWCLPKLRRRQAFVDHQAMQKTRLQRSLAIREQALGPEHPDVAASLENYAALLREVGRAAEANTLAARADLIRTRAKRRTN